MRYQKIEVCFINVCLSSTISRLLIEKNPHHPNHLLLTEKVPPKQTFSLKKMSLADSSRWVEDKSRCVLSQGRKMHLRSSVDHLPNFSRCPVRPTTDVPIEANITRCRPLEIPFRLPQCPKGAVNRTVQAKMRVLASMYRQRIQWAQKPYKTCKSNEISYLQNNWLISSNSPHISFT